MNIEEKTITQSKEKRKSIELGKKKCVDDLMVTVPICLSDELAV